MSSSALPETLRTITATKIDELSTQHEAYEEGKANVLKRAEATSGLIAGVTELLAGACKLSNIKLPESDANDDDDKHVSFGPEADLMRNSQLLLKQAMVDPSVPRSLVEEIRDQIEEQLDLRSCQQKHAKLFSELVTEWLSKPDRPTVAPSETDEAFEPVGRDAMHTQRQEWESIVFSSAKVDVAKIEHYLKHWFHSSKHSSTALDSLIRTTRDFCAELDENKNVFSVATLQRYIPGLLATDLMTDAKVETLKTFKLNKEVLQEVADVLNMRWANLDKWQWCLSGKAIPVEQRKQLNGKYRVYMDPDVLDALLLYVVGLKFSVHFRTVFGQFFYSHAWKHGNASIPKLTRARREYYLGDASVPSSSTVQSERRTTYCADYFMTQLPADEKVGKKNYDDDDNDSDNDIVSDRKSPMELKHGLLHLLVAEALVARTEAPHTVIRSDFEWFGPSLPHDTIYTVLKFFGIQSNWLSFFRRFLEVPTRFIQDGPNAEARVRRCGVPMSHTLSDLFGEVILFAMDFAVNQRTSSYMYRLHDDFWFWGSTPQCVNAWSVMTGFAQTMGLRFNAEKTGTVTFNNTRDADTASAAQSAATQGLPKGEVRWGLLILSPTSGMFEIDQAKVDEHVSELKIQLSSCNSIFSWVQAYNQYFARFLTNNFGKPSYGFGASHIDQIISTFSRIQKALFPNGSVTDYLAEQIRTRFGAEDLPRGFFYWPINLGGLELRNPLISLLAMRESMRRSPGKILQEALDGDEQGYLLAKENFDRKNTGSGLSVIKNSSASVLASIQADGDNFMAKDEYLQYRDVYSVRLCTAYRVLLQVPGEEEMRDTPEISKWRASAGSAAREIRESGTMQPYWKWMVAMYGRGIWEQYGSLKMVEREMVPLGVVSVMKAGRVRWQG